MFKSFIFKINYLMLVLREKINHKHYILVCWDADALVWYIYASSIKGLALDADTQEALLKKIECVVPELLALNNQKIPNNDDRSSPLPYDTSFWGRRTRAT